MTASKKQALGRQRPRPYAFLVRKPKLDRSYEALREEVRREATAVTQLPIPERGPMASKFPRVRMPVGGPRP